MATTTAPGHIGLNVTDLERSVSFYRRALGFDQLGASTEGEHRYAFLGSDGVLRLTLWQQSDGTFSAHTPGCTTFRSRWTPSTRSGRWKRY